MKIYIYNDSETANKVARTIYKIYGVNVDQRGTALKMAEAIYNKYVNQTFGPRASWIARHIA